MVTPLRVLRKVDTFTVNKSDEIVKNMFASMHLKARKEKQREKKRNNTIQI